MVRKTKEDAQATRELILDTAELVFQRRGVSRTSLQEIAQEAGLTRGAIYWHFENKGDLFNAMMQRVTSPMLSRLSRHQGVDTEHPMVQMRHNVVMAFDETINNAQARRVFEIATFKVEYVDELQFLRDRHREDRSQCLADMRSLLDAAQRKGLLREGLDLDAITVGLHALVTGLMQNWLLDPEAFRLDVTGLAVLDAYLAGIVASGA